MNNLFNLEAQKHRLNERYQVHSGNEPTLPTLSALEAAESTLPDPSSPSYLAGLPHEEVARHIIDDIVPALCGQSRSSRYFGFVTGGTLPIAEWADNVVSHMDQNVQVHLPLQSVATKVEDAALEMLVRVLRLDGEEGWKGRTFTTGATASNILGLACGREAVLARKLQEAGAEIGVGVGDMGILTACIRAGVREIQVLTSAGHSSLSKAASVIGLGRQSVKELPRDEAKPWKLDLDAVERELQREGTASIIVLSGGEVNTGRYALDNMGEWKRLRELADRYGAWIHLDGAFGIFSRALEDRDEYQLLHTRNEGFGLADSITVDGHKLLNVPYDCGMFLTRSPSLLQQIFQNPNAAYLSSSSSSSSASGASNPSPLNIGIENSRRFRALPAYAVLLSEGRPGLASLFHHMVQLSRRLAAFLQESPHYELLPDEGANNLEEIFMIVLFRAKDRALNDDLVERINGTRQMYVSGTSWKGEKAVRVAVASWKVDVERDLKMVTGILNHVAEGTASLDIGQC